MSRVHYFQRYAQQENVVTNNTLLLLSRLYHYSPLAFEAVLHGLLDDAALSVGPHFRQQERAGRGSVPDADIAQSSFRVVVETKLYKHFSERQLLEHLNAFQGEDTRVLLLLSPHEPDEAHIEQVRRAVSGHGDGAVRFVPTTFRAVIDAARDALPDHVSEMRELVDDYEDFCSMSGLLPTDHYKMRVVTCGLTLAENLRYGLYYHRADRGYTDLGYLGFYADKSVRVMGRVKTIVQAELIGGDFNVVWEKDRPLAKLDASDRDNIVAAMQDAKESQGWDIERDHVFFVLERPYETDFRKVSKHGLMRERHFDLREELGVDELPPTEEIAARLRELTWE